MDIPGADRRCGDWKDAAQIVMRDGEIYRDGGVLQEHWWTVMKGLGKLYREKNSTTPGPQTLARELHMCLLLA